MHIDKYQQLIAELLRRPDIAAAGTMAYAAARCVQYVSECGFSDADLQEAIQKLEDAAGIKCNENGEYYES